MKLEREAVISFKPSVHDSNVENWVRAGRMLGVSGEDATRAAGVQNVQYFANGGFTDGSKEKLDNLIDFSKAYADYALRSNGIKSTGDVVSMMWTVANNAMSGDGSLELVATSIAADVAPIILNKYLGSDSSDGSLVAPDGNGTTTGTVKLNYTGGHWEWDTTISDSKDESRGALFKNTTAASSVGDAAKLILMSLALMPDTALTGDGIDATYGNDNFWANNAADERCPFRGGNWSGGECAGVFGLSLGIPRSSSWANRGGRSAFVKLPAEA